MDPQEQLCQAERAGTYAVILSLLLCVRRNQAGIQSHGYVTSDEPEDPYTEKEFNAIVAAVDPVPSFTNDVAERAKALIAVMRYAGLSIQDAAILERVT
jgi:hypothetical protein